MARFEDAFNRLQREQPHHEPTREEVARATYERQQADYVRDYNDPVNVRYREILGMMATTLTEHGFSQKPYTQAIGADREYSYHHMSHGKWNKFTGEIIEGSGWKIHLRTPKYERRGVNENAPKDLSYLFLAGNGQTADTVESPVIVPVEHPKVSIKDLSELNRPIIERDGKLYVAYSQLYRPFDQGLRGTLPLESNKERYDDPYFELNDGELFCHYSMTYDESYPYTHGRFSFEDTLARLLASKLSE